MTSAKLFLDGENIGKPLKGMIDIVFHVEHRDLRPAREFPQHRVCAAVFPIHRVAIATDRNGVAHSIQDACHVRYAFGAVGDLAAFHRGGVDFAWIEIVRVPAQLGHAGFKGVACPQRLIVEDHEQGFAAQELVVQYAPGALAFQILCHLKNRLDFLAREISLRQKVASFQTLGLHAQLRSC